jgi:hypothetical protein
METEIENKLKFKIGLHEGIAGDWGKVTWKRSKDTQDVDWKAAFTALALYKGIPQDYVEMTLKMSTVTKPGSRRFLFSPKEDWHYEPHRTGLDEGTASGALAAGTIARDGGDGGGGASGSDH